MLRVSAAMIALAIFTVSLLAQAPKAISKLEPKAVEPALQFGYYMETYGTPFKYFKADGVHTGMFKGRRLTYGRARDYFWGAFEKLPLLGTGLNRRHLARSKQLLEGKL